MANIHVSLAWMSVKALLAHGRAISADTSRILDSMEETRLMLQRRVSPERVRRLTLFGCRRHPDAKLVNKLQADQFTVNVSLIFQILFYTNSLNPMDLPQLKYMYKS